MNISEILAHPTPGSFNHAIAEAAVVTLRHAGHQVPFQDLYQEEFSPVLPGPEVAEGSALDLVVAGHCREIAAADGIVIVHPNW